MLCPAVFPGKSGTGASFEKSLPSPICPPAWAAAALSYSAVVALADPSLSRHSLTHAGQSALPNRLPRRLHRQEHVEPIIRQAAEPKPGVERSRCVILGIHLDDRRGDRLRSLHRHMQGIGQQCCPNPTPLPRPCHALATASLASSVVGSGIFAGSPPRSGNTLTESLPAASVKYPTTRFAASTAT